MLTLDGASGEGGGQLLRSSLALSMITGTPFRLENVRAGRKRPGLQRQHLTCVLAAQEVCGAVVEGARLDSLEVTFRPGAVRPGAYAFNVGTAGSTGLVFQTVLLPLALTGRPSELSLEGGTHNPMAPSFDFLERVYLPLLEPMGLRCSVRLERPGFYPRGGGRWRASLAGSAEGRPVRAGVLTLVERGAVVRRRVCARTAGLARDIAERELSAALGALGWDVTEGVAEKLDARVGPGNVVLVEVESERVTELFAGFGERGVRAEDVALAVSAEAGAYLSAGVPVGEHLADQLLLPLALGEGGVFRTTAPSLHSTTHAEVLRAFLGTETAFTDEGSGAWRVTVAGTVT
ncbi:MAG: RNA 3'-terminal phosphate cyclase [Deltaproteobacteria bacterium]|nr:RNA 3'-terminal phosphate cyclase [Deltaproteobacteria bacterium]